jgi:hypothetical protein
MKNENLVLFGQQYSLCWEQLDFGSDKESKSNTAFLNTSKRMKNDFASFARRQMKIETILTPAELPAPAQRDLRVTP